MKNPVLSSETVHASTVAIEGRAVLIAGRSGSGKSDLALRLIDRGAVLVSDDYTFVRRADGRLLASPPDTIAGRIELRGVGIVEMANLRDVPVALAGQDGRVIGVVFERTADIGGKLVGAGERFTLDADMVMCAVGQVLVPSELGGADVLALTGGRIVVDDERRTSMPGVWAGGDCVAGGLDLTVAAVEDGKQAALSINRALTGVVAHAAE